MLSLLLRRRLASAKNRLLSLTPWEWARNCAFAAMGLWMLAGLYYVFHRLLGYLDSVQLIGPLLLWKLTAMAMLTTFSMVVLSSLIISLTTLFYAQDLRYLMRAPVGLRTVFFDKALEAAFFSSWMIMLALFPYIIALGRVKGYGLDFYAAFLFLLLPCLLLAAALGMAFTLTLMYLFPSSRTRDAVWILSSLSVALLYVLMRFSRPERLVRPDMLKLVAEYLRYLQAPTAPYAPSWWMTEALAAYVSGKNGVFLARGLQLVLTAAASYLLLVLLAGKTYAAAYSGAQESRRVGRAADAGPAPEMKVAAALGRGRAVCALFWKERKTFFRDVRHWSQLMLVGALVCVYLFSISRLPLDTPELKSLVCFLNIGMAGFVLSSLGLRFTFPAISLEGRGYWVTRSAPLSVRALMIQKFLFSALPTAVLATILVATANHLLQADRFTSWLSLGTIWLAAFALCAMGVGLGAFFPRFSVENIHQIESSAGGFVYMACALGYIAATLAAEAWPMQMHLQASMGRLNAWNWRLAGLSALVVAVINSAAIIVPWTLGRRHLEAYEGD